MADQIIILSAKGGIRAQGQWLDLIKKGMINDDFIMNPTAHEGHVIADGGNKPIPKVLQGPSANDTADLHRQTGDLSLYSYYGRAIGAKIGILSLCLSLSYSLCAYLPRKCKPYQQLSCCLRSPEIWIKWYTSGTISNATVFCVVFAVFAIAACLSIFSSAW